MLVLISTSNTLFFSTMFIFSTTISISGAEGEQLRNFDRLHYSVVKRVMW